MLLQGNHDKRESMGLLLGRLGVDVPLKY